MPYDLLITNGTIVDGTGGARFNADVVVKGGSIAALGKIDGSAATVIDAAIPNSKRLEVSTLFGIWCLELGAWYLVLNS